MTIRRTAEDRARFYALRAELHDMNAEAAAARKEARLAHRKATKAARGESPMKDQRQPRVRDNAFLAFLRRQPCLVCGRTPSDPAHIRFAPHGSGWRYVGKGEKPDDARAVSLCRECHTRQHAMSERRFWEEVLRLDPVATCASLRQRFERGGS